MLIVVGSALIILICGWAQYRNGFFTSCAMLISVVLSGLVAFNFFEPVADLLEPVLQGSMIGNCEDYLALALLFAVTLLVLRLAVNRLAPELIDAQGALQYFGAGGVGLVMGYLVSGFLICATQTLPLDVRFLDFEPRDGNESFQRSVFPADRVWLAMMRHAGASPFRWRDDPNSDPPGALTFDQAGTFELRYLRHRRSSETQGPIPYSGEFDRELGRMKK